MANQGDGCPSLAGKPGGPAPEFIMQVRRTRGGGGACFPAHPTHWTTWPNAPGLSLTVT